MGPLLGDMLALILDLDKDSCEVGTEQALYIVRKEVIF